MTLKVRSGESVKPTNVKVRGNSGDSKLSKEEAKLAQVLAGLDGKGGLSIGDLEKLKKMKPSEQIAYVNKALKGTGYKVADVYNGEEDEKSSGITWTSNGVFINFSKGGKTINVDEMGASGGNAGHLGITYK